MAEDNESKKQEFLCSYTELWDVGKLTPHPRNPNKHPEKQLKLLAKIIEGHGWRAPITVSKRSGYVIRGHGRLAAAMLLDCAKVPVDLQDYATEAEEYADMIADNRIAELSEIDQGELDKLIGELDKAEYDMGRLGYSDNAIKSMLAENQKKLLGGEDNFDVDGVFATIDDPICKPGDVWLLGKHRLMCGDSTKAEDVAKLMGDDKADMMFTDPPYNVDYTGKTAKKLKIQNDMMTSDKFYEFLCAAMSNAFSVVKDGGAFYVCYASREAQNFRQAMVSTGWSITEELVWVKNLFVMGHSDYQWKHEPILYGNKPGKAHFFYGGRKSTTVIPDNFPLSVTTDEDGSDLLTFNFGVSTLTVKCKGYEVINTDAASTAWRVDKPMASTLHPTMKPIALVTKAIVNSTLKDEIVLDLFGGSGSTLIACEGSQRVCRTMEYDRKYCDVIIRRWEALTKQKAVLALIM